MALKFSYSIGSYKPKTVIAPDTSGISSGTAIGYIGQKAVAGLAGVFEGIGTLYDVTAAKLKGNDDYAAYRAQISAVGNWKKSLDEHYKPGVITSFLGDAAEGVGQSSAFLLNAAVPFLGTGVFFAGVTGNSVAQAAQHTGKVGLKEYAYGITMGASEAALEAIVGAGGQVASSLATKGATTLGKATVSRAARNGIGKQIITEATGEFFEEFLGDYVDAGAQRLYGINKDASVSFTEALRSGLVGMVSGAVMGGTTELGKAAVHTNSGSRIQQNGNVDTLLKQANAIADAFGTEGTNKGKNQKMNQFIASVQASTDAYNALSDEQKAGTRGAMYLGEIQSAMAGVQINAGVLDSLDKIQLDADSFADYASKYFERTVTADDIRTNKDNLAMTLAILRYTGEFMTPSENEQMQRRVSEAISKGRAEQKAAFDEAVSLGVNPFEAQTQTESKTGENYNPVNFSENWNGESAIFNLPTGESLFIEPSGDGTYKVYEGADSDFASGEARIYTMSEAEVREALEGARAYSEESVSRRDQSRVDQNQNTTDFAEATQNAEKSGTESASESAGKEVSGTENGAQNQQNGAENGQKESDVKEEEGSENVKRSLKDRIRDRFSGSKESISEEDAASRAELAKRQDRARRAVRDYDTLSVEVRKSIDMMYESAEKSGVDAKTADAAASLISVMDKMIVQFENDLDAGNGYYVKLDDGWRAIVIDAKSDAEGGATATLLHEVVHSITGTRGYNVLSDLALEQLDMAEQERIERQYREFDPGMSDEAIREEVTAEAVAKILSKGDYIDALENKTPIARAISSIKTVAKLLIDKNKDAYRAARRLGIAFSRCIGENPQAAVKNTVRTGAEDEEREDSEAKYRQKKGPDSDSVKFGKEVDEWVKTGKPDGEVFVLGSTGDVLQGLGAIDSDIYMTGDKIKRILSDHPEMTMEEIKKIPQILEDPILILNSKNKTRNGQNSRMVIFGSVKAQNKLPVMTVLDLRPTENHLVIDDMQKVTSAYTKTKNPSAFVRSSEVLYADTKRTAKLLRTMGLQLRPIELQNGGYIGSISYVDQNVNISGEKFSKIFTENFDGENPDIHYQLSEEQKAVNRAKRQEEAAKLKQERAAFVKEYGVDTKEIDEFAAAQIKNAKRKASSAKLKMDFLHLARYLGLASRYDGNRQAAINAKERVQQLADQIAVELTRQVEVDEDLKEIKNHLKGKKLKIEDDLKGDLPGGYNEFRKKNFGRLTISSEGTAVDTIYDELAGIFGEGYFPSSITNQADQLIRIAEIAGNPVETLVEADDGTISHMSMRIQKGLYDIMQKKIESTVGYKQGKIAGFEEAVGRYGKKYNQKDAKAVIKSLEQAADKWASDNGIAVSMRSDYRPSYLTERIYQMFNSSTKYQIEDRARVIADNYLHELTYNKFGITRFSGELAGDEHFESLRKELASIVKSQYETLGEETKYAKLKREEIAKIAEFQAKRRVDQRESNVIEHIRRLVDLASGKTKPSDHVDYDEMNAMLGGLKGVLFNGRVNVPKLRQWSKWFTENVINAREEDVTDSIAYLQETLSAELKNDIRDIGEGDAEELTEHMMNTLYTMVKEFENVYRSYGRVYLDGQWVETKEVSKKAVEQVRTAVNVNDRDGILKKFKSTVLRFLLNAQDPIRVSEMLEGYSPDGILSRLVRDVVVSEAEATSMYKDLMNPFDAFFVKNKDYQKRLAETVIHSEFFGVDMSVGEAITLYMTSKREQAMLGLANSDIIFSPTKAGKKRVTVAGNVRFADMTAEQKVDLLTGGITEIYRQFGQTDKAFIELAEQFFNEQSSKIKRKADKAYFGHEMEMEKYYIPIARHESGIARNITDATKAIANFATLSNLSFNKKTVKNAQKSLYIRPVWDVITDHADGLSKYATMYQPAVNFNRVWNAQTSDVKGHNESLASVLESDVWGKIDGKFSSKGAEGYYTQLFNDIQGVGKSSRPGDSVISFLRSGAVTFGLGANPKVWLTQNTSLIACMDTLDPKYYAYVFSYRSDELMDKYSLYARTRDYDSEVIRAQGLVDKVGKVGELTMKPISYFDRQVVRMLWSVAQAQVQGQKGYAIGSEENLKEAGKLLDRAILRNQQTAGQGTRSGFMRGSEITKTLTMFSADSMKQLSSLVEAVGIYNRARTDAKKGVEGASARANAAGKQLVRSGIAVAGVAIAMAAITELFRALYKKDRRKDQEGNEISVAGDMTIESFGNMISILPIIREVYGLVTDGYDLTDFTLDAASDTISAFTGAISDVTKAAQGKYVSSETAMSDARDVVFAIGRTLGIPLNNVNNVLTGVLNVAPGNLDWSYKAIFSKPSYKSDLDEAIANGDDGLAVLILKTWMYRESGGAGESAETLLDLYKNGYDVLAPTVPTSVTVNGESVSVTAKQRKQMLAILEEAQNQVVDMIVSKEWSDLNDAAKAKAIRVMYDAAYSNAKAETVGTTASKKAVLSTLYDPETVALISAFAGTTGVIRQGNEEIGKKTQIEEYLTGFTGDQSLLLYIAGYTSDNAKELLRRRIEEYTSDKEEQERLASILDVAEESEDE